LVKELRAKAKEPKFSKREGEVLTLLGDGLTNREIANRLVVTESTVRTYIYRLQEKLGFKNRLEISIYAGRRHFSFSRTPESLNVLETGSERDEMRGVTSVSMRSVPGSTSEAAGESKTEEKGSTASTAIAAEQKAATALSVELDWSADAVDVMEADKIDEIIRECLDLVAEDIHLYGGTVAWFTARGIMSLFGVPVSLELGPQKALYAALAIQEHMQAQQSNKGIQIRTRIGVNTGGVQVEKYPGGLTTKHIPMGNTTELATRVLDVAKPGTVVVTESTYRMTRYLFSFEPMGEARLTRQREPGNIYRLMGQGPAKDRLQAAALRGLTKFVGRQKEIETLKEAFLKARSGSGQMIGIVGDAGIGKSRLLLQFREWLPRNEFSYLEGSCIHYGDSIPYLPFQRALKLHFDFQEGESESLIRAKMETEISKLGEKFSHVLPPLQDVLSVKVEDEEYLKLESVQRKERIFEAIRDILLAESRSRAVVLVIEDVHWID
jgi:class 3 adenylate cyclase/DNA-binding CsgD family transcriptional regulator